MKKRFIEGIREFFRDIDAVYKQKAVDVIEYETREMENIFALLVLGSFIGLPSPPLQLTLELMPYMEEELEIMLEKVGTAHDPMGELFSVLDIE